MVHLDAYEEKRRAHGRKLLEKSRMIVDASYKKFEESIDKALKPKRDFQRDLEIGRKFLPLCLNEDKLKMFLTYGYEGRGAVDMAKFKRLTGFAHSYAYEIRNALLKELKEKEVNEEILKNLDIDKVKEFNGKEKEKSGWRLLETTEDANLAKLNESQMKKFIEVLIAYIDS